MRPIVLADDFLKDNYLSTELRVPVTLLGINACSPLATNAIRNNIWDNFSSESYKQLPSVGTIKIRHPVTGAESDYPLPAGGRGYIRPASLVSLWSTAPFLQNNTVGHFEWSPSVDARMRSFQDSIEQMLWPEKRDKDPLFANENGPGVGVIDRTTVDSYVEMPEAYIPDHLRGLVGARPSALPVPGRRQRLLGQDRTVPERDAGQSAHQHGSGRGRLARPGTRGTQEAAADAPQAREERAEGQPRSRRRAREPRRRDARASASARTSSSTRGTTSARASSNRSSPASPA